MERGYCLICGKNIEIQMCCNGYMCGCMGQPVEPPLCSEKCHDVYANKPPIKYEDMSIHQLGALLRERLEEQLYVLDEIVNESETEK